MIKIIDVKPVNNRTGLFFCYDQIIITNDIYLITLSIHDKFKRFGFFTANDLGTSIEDELDGDYNTTEEVSDGASMVFYAEFPANSSLFCVKEKIRETAKNLQSLIDEADCDTDKDAAFSKFKSQAEKAFEYLGLQDSTYAAQIANASSLTQIQYI